MAVMTAAVPAASADAAATKAGAGLTPGKPEFIADTSCFKPLQFKGKPFFVLGNWDARNETNFCALNPFLHGAGMNAFVMHVNCLDDTVHRRDLAACRWFRDNHPDIAIIVKLHAQFILKEVEPKKYKELSQDEIAARRDKFLDTLKELKSYGNILGYTLDELENKLNPTLPEWRRANADRVKDLTDAEALAVYMEDATLWVRKAIKEAHPEALYMPVQAWWTTYDKSSQLYDVLMPNEYPVAGKTEEYFYVAKDAQKAALATKKFNKPCFIYCPPGFNVLGRRWKSRNFTREEIRYFWFTPISSGAMGIMGWRQKRTDPQFAAEVIYPVMNEVSSLVPWFLGDNCDKNVSCDRAGDFTLHKVRKVSRMVDKEDEDYIPRYVRTVSWILRRNPADGSWLLLACNNTNSEQECSFTFDKEVATTYALDIYTFKTHQNPNRGLRVKFKPYDVKVFLMPDAARQPE